MSNIILGNVNGNRAILPSDIVVDDILIKGIDGVTGASIIADSGISNTDLQQVVQDSINYRLLTRIANRDVFDGIDTATSNITVTFTNEMNHHLSTVILQTLDKDGIFFEGIIGNWIDSKNLELDFDNAFKEQVIYQLDFSALKNDNDGKAIVPADWKHTIFID
ncbi:MAG: hypothetical protein LBT04_03015 [Prevotellaceae bacterium]|jgi:hypothetical protein|nr:hypothetical protein [Prevotellaceae bacterium]